jgi:hypothetical protein
MHSLARVDPKKYSATQNIAMRKLLSVRHRKCIFVRTTADHFLMHINRNVLQSTVQFSGAPLFFVVVMMKNDRGSRPNFPVHLPLSNKPGRYSSLLCLLAVLTGHETTASLQEQSSYSIEIRRIREREREFERESKF